MTVIPLLRSLILDGNEKCGLDIKGDLIGKNFVFLIVQSNHSIWWRRSEKPDRELKTQEVVNISSEKKNECNSNKKKTFREVMSFFTCRHEKLWSHLCFALF